MPDPKPPVIPVKEARAVGAHIRGEAVSVVLIGMDGAHLTIGLKVDAARELHESLGRCLSRADAFRRQINNDIIV